MPPASRVNAPAAYPPLMRALHWLVAVLVLSQLALGKAMHDADGELLPAVFAWHVAVGILLLALVVVRLGNRLRSRVPPLPATMPAWERVAARTVHATLYALLLAAPALGYLAASAAPEGAGVTVLGLALDAPVPASRELADTLGRWHSAIVGALAWLLVLHVGAVFKHAFFDRPEHDVLRRMV